MLATVIAAALSPNVGVVQAQATAQYGTPAATTSPFPWLYVGVIVGIVAGGILAYLVVRRRRPPPEEGSDAPPADDEGYGN